MEQLIAKLEAKIDELTQRLHRANEEIKQLKEAQQQSSFTQNASMDLLQNMVEHRPEDQLQLYIEDSLDLLKTHKSSKLHYDPKGDVENQLSFDLTYEPNNHKTSTMTEEYTDYMSNQSNTPEQIQSPPTTSKADEVAVEKAPLTPEQKKRQKNQKNNRRLIKMLEDRYPKAFDWNQPKPLKVGIDKDMTLDDEFNVSKQKRALAAYTRSDRYKKCLLSGQPRVDLNGIAVSDEPALPNATVTQAQKHKKAPSSSQANKPATGTKRTPPPKNKPQHKRGKPTKLATQQDDIYKDLSPEERMKAKLEKLLNKP